MKIKKKKKKKSKIFTPDFLFSPFEMFNFTPDTHFKAVLFACLKPKHPSETCPQTP